MGDSLIGVAGDGFVILAADTEVSRSVLILKSVQTKMFPLDDFKLIAASGDTGDRNHFCEFVQRNVQLNYFRSGIYQRSHAVANWTRGELARALREKPYQVNLLFAGYDREIGPSLYTMDYLASMHKVKYACQGYAGYFVSSILDKNWREGLSVEETLRLIKDCTEELRTRFVLKNPNWELKIVDKDGIRDLELPQ